MTTDTETSADLARRVLATVAGTSHRIVREWHAGGASALETRVTFTRLDGSATTLPAFGAWQRGTDGLFTDYRVVADLAPLFAP